MIIFRQSHPTPLPSFYPMQEIEYNSLDLEVFKVRLLPDTWVQTDCHRNRKITASPTKAKSLERSSLFRGESLNRNKI